MISCKKILIVALAALILGGGMVSMSMHAMHAMQQQRGLNHLWQEWKPFITFVGKATVRIAVVPALVMLAVTAASKAWFCGKNPHLFINVTPESLAQANKHFEDVAHELCTGAVLGTWAYYIHRATT